MKNILLLTTSLTACAFFGVAVGTAHAGPEDGVVAAGYAVITNGINRVDIHQSTDRAVIDWRSFNINQNETAQFHQPGTNSLTVNRINDSNPSQILGTLKANGNVVLINRAGIAFGKDAVVDVGGLVATTSDLSNANAMAGNLNFDVSGNVDAAIINEGTITARDAGLVGLVAPQVENRGIINAKLGKVNLGSAGKYTLDLYGDGAISVAVNDETTRQIVANTGKINAEGGTVQLTAAAGAGLVTSLIQVDGEIKVPQATAAGGKIIISGNDATAVSITGNLDASGTTGGTVTVTAKNIVQQGTINANGTNGQGGQVNLAFKNTYLDKEAAAVTVTGTNGNGGTIAVKGDTDSRAFVSGQYDASSSTHKGGTIQMTADNGDLKLYGARVSANGKTQGGKINIGGEYQGTGTLKQAKTTTINYATTLSADATDNGKGGEVIVWSKDKTLFGGTAYARGGVNGGNGGLIEISSKDTMKIAGNATTSAAARKSGYQAGTLLLDPKNLTIEAGGIQEGGVSYFEFIDPNPNSGSYGFGYNSYVLSNGNVLIADPSDDLIAADSGAVYLYNGATGGLISTLTGGQANDLIGDYYIQEINVTGNFLISSSEWQNGAIAGAGAATWGNGITGISGIVSASNSLVGSSNNDHVGYGARVLTNGNYLIITSLWDNGAVTNAGAVTWANGTTGITGTINATNSLIGSTSGDAVGSSVFALTNGNYVVTSTSWDNGAIANAGAVTWGNGLGGTTGVVSAANSIIGSTANDYVGGGGIVQLTNGNYVFGSNNWDNGAVVDAGAVTWGNGTGGTVGVLSSANSLVGSTASDMVGLFNTITALTNGNYVVRSGLWDNGAATNAGAATWGNGTGGTVGAITAANSLVGTQSSDQVGLSIIALPNGNYLVGSPSWRNGANAGAGAVTWGNGLGGTVGAVSAANSLVGSRASDGVGTTGNIIVLKNGNYVVNSPYWDNGAISNAGAVTWGSGATGVSGAVSAANSLVGTKTNDRVGVSGITTLSNGNYVVGSYFWSNGAATSAGAVTWGNGLGGTVGGVSISNSLVGSTVLDNVGETNGVVELANGNYVVTSSRWDNGAIANAGAVTWASGTGGTVGVINASNSLVGGTANDYIGGSASGAWGLLALSNGNYVVTSNYFDNGSAVDAGAITWGNGLGGTVGVMSAANSSVGSTTNDMIGSSGVIALTNGNYVFASGNWDNGALANVGAVTWGNGLGGTVGALNATNSLIGNIAGDQVGNTGLKALSNGHYTVTSQYWDNGAIVDASALTLGNGLGGTVGYINSYNSILGTTTGGYLFNSMSDNVNNRILVRNSPAQQAYYLYEDFATLGMHDSYSDIAAVDVSLSPDFITGVLNAGTAVVLQANNDITVNDDIIANNPSGNGGNLTLQAGRSILINANIVSDNGNVYLLGNQKLATGIVNAYRSAGDAVIAMATGTSINAGTGNVIIRLDDGAGLTNNGAGDITLAGITANSILVENVNATGDVVLDTGAQLTGTGTGTAITLVSNRNFINNSSSTALAASSGRWLVYSTDPASDTLGGLTRDFRRFSCTYGGSCPTFGATGNGLLYSYTPVLTVTPNAIAAINEGSAVPNLNGYAYSVSGYLDAADQSDDAVTGAVNGTTGYTTASPVGIYDISYGSGTLASAMGYGFTYGNNLSAITVNAAPPTPPPAATLPDTVAYQGLGGYLNHVRTEMTTKGSVDVAVKMEAPKTIDDSLVMEDSPAESYRVKISKRLKSVLDLDSLLD